MKFLSLLPFIISFTSALREIPTTIVPSTHNLFIIQLNGPFQQCGNDDLIQVSSVSLTPSAPRAGYPLTISASGILKESIVDGAKLSLIAKLGPIVVKSKIVDICTDSDPEIPLKITCPILPGFQTLNVTMLLKDDLPSLNYNLKAVAKNADGKQIVCLQGTIKIIPKDTRVWDDEQEDEDEMIVEEEILY